MKESRRICLIPFFGSVIYLIKISFKAMKSKKVSTKTHFKYMLWAGLFGALGILIAGLFMRIINQIFTVNEELNKIFLLISAWLFMWPLITLPIIEFDKKITQILGNENEIKEIEDKDKSSYL